MEKKNTSVPPYVADNNWEHELNYKLWSTKSSRFQASSRLLEKANLSNISLAFLSSYLIIINLIPLFFPDLKIDSNIVAFFTTAISILLLVYTQIESSNEYKLKSHLFHQCSLEIADLYNELRMVKNSIDEVFKNEKINEITIKYNELLKSYVNHEPIDLEIFKTTKAKYHNLNKWDVFIIKIKYYFIVKFKYHLLILLPLFFMFIYLLFKEAK